MAKVLIVEDDRELANFVRSYLEFENHDVDVTHTGTQAQEKLLASHYNLVILDWEIPEMTGVDLLKDYRAQGGEAAVLMLTGKDQIEDKAIGLDCGADDYLTKPFDMKELGARMRALLRRQEKASSNLPAIANVRLDKNAQRALQNGRSVALTLRELQFLEFLSAHPGASLSADEYIRSIWQDEPGITPAVLKSTILRLRKKLDPEGRFVCPHLFLHTGDSTGDTTATTAGSAGPIGQGDDLDLLSGTVLDGKYELLELLGAGGTGFIYKAKHLELGSMVAIKMLAPALAARSEHVRRFKREANLAIGLSHPNILNVHDFGISSEGQPYLVMEIVHGESVADLLARQGALGVHQTICILKQVCDALAYAHEQGAVHRDLKPSNIMLIESKETGGTHKQGMERQGEANPFVKVVDFGLAKAVHTDQQIDKVTLTGEVIGSPAYMSPEQCRGLPVDRRADIYALGCVLYEMLTGEHVFPGVDPIAVIFKQVTETPAPLALTGVDSERQATLNKIAMKCLAKDPEERYQSVSMLRAALESA